MPSYPLKMRRHLPCTLTADVLPPSPAHPDLLQVNFALSMPTFGLHIEAPAVIRADAILGTDRPEDALYVIGLDALRRCLGFIQSNAQTNLPPLAPLSLERLREVLRSPASLESENAPSLNLNSADEEILRGFGISPD